MASLTLLFAVGAAVIGGTSLFGGKGRVIDAVSAASWSPSSTTAWACSTSRPGGVYIVTGLVLLLAASVDAISRKRAAATGRI